LSIRCRTRRSRERQRLSPLPALSGCDEFPVGYASASCSPAVPASASPTANDSQQPMLPYNYFAANGNNPLNSVSQLKGALQTDILRFVSPYPAPLALGLTDPSDPLNFQPKTKRLRSSCPAWLRSGPS